MALNKKEKETHGILSQIRLNKNKIQIFKIINVTLNNYENLKNSLSKYTGRNIKELDILFF